MPFFVVVRIDGQLSDTHASASAPSLDELTDQLVGTGGFELVDPPPGPDALVEFAIVSARDAGAARLTRDRFYRTLDAAMRAFVVDVVELPAPARDPGVAKRRGRTPARSRRRTESARAHPSQMVFDFYPQAFERSIGHS